jgi:hypothetical protein
MSQRENCTPNTTVQRVAAGSDVIETERLTNFLVLGDKA